MKKDRTGRETVDSIITDSEHNSIKHNKPKYANEGNNATVRFFFLKSKILLFDGKIIIKKTIQ